MKKFRAIILLLIIVVAIFCSLTACHNNADKYFFAKSVLDDNLVPDLPQIKWIRAEKKYKRLYNYETTLEDFDDYVSSVYEYLCSLDIKYLGYRGDEISSFFGGAPTYEFYIGEKLSDFKYTEDRFGNKLENCYVFVWANEIDPDTNTLLQKHYLYLQYYSEKTNANEYNVSIELSFGIQSYVLISTTQ